MFYTRINITETRTQQDCKFNPICVVVYKMAKMSEKMSEKITPPLILQKTFPHLHYSSDLWAAASLEEDSSLGPEMTNAFPFYY